ncbi:hypothetical protein GCM10009069_21370 [Algimonas arctica]|uniref:Uncharacterized protein n=2 Tax=Algimonas arctica TaxID=1479486 RepID=A0A8J3CSY7_9PROT|nr:hypothetical protein GCM10009069_21370 [Algimonas arctica]
MERCLLLDPCYDFGSKYLTFLRNGKIIPREDLSKTDKRIADTHLRIMQLNRQFLVTERRTSFDKTVSRLKSGALSLKNTISTNAEKISFNQIDSTVHWETFIFDASVDYPGAISKIALNVVHKASPNFKGNLREALSIFENSISDNFRDDPLGKELEYKEIADASIVKVTTQFDPINLDTLNAPLQSVTIKNFKAISSIELGIVSLNGDSRISNKLAHD